MRISIIIPAFNEEKLITRCLAQVKEACRAFGPLGWTYEILVCDNNSTDRTAELAQEAGATVVFEPVNQIGRARNTGAWSASGDWLVFVDADSLPGVELFRDVAECIASGRYIAGGSTVKLDRAPLAGRLLTSGWNLLSRARRWVAGSFIFCDAEVFRQMGGFNLDFYAGEELDLSQRLKKLGRRMGKRVVILHRHPLTTSGRKFELYSPMQLVRFLLRAAALPRRTMRSRKACSIWYDGAR